MERFRNYYQQVDSNMMEIEIKMHGEPLVVMSAYIPHDGVHEDSRLEVWGDLSDRINHISGSKNLVILGDFNSQLHIQKEGE
eukprot:11147987-Heterocapsa_arctica.AAC.1